MQDGASPHTFQDVLDFLFRTLGQQRVITSRRRASPPPGCLEWPPYSSDLTPLDF